jgi:GntR family transcriptional regulator
VADELRAQISSGDLAPGAPLPTADALARSYGVGVDTARDAIGELKAAGLVETRRGHPARVRGRGEVETVRVQRYSRIVVRMPDPDERAEFGMGEGVPLVVVTTGAKVVRYPADRHDFTTS